MRIKINRKLLKENVATELQEKVAQVKHLHETLSFLNPELTVDEINERVIFQLACIAEPKLLSGLIKLFNDLGEKKLDEVTDLYCNFFSDDYNDNNN